MQDFSYDIQQSVPLTAVFMAASINGFMGSRWGITHLSLQLSAAAKRLGQTHRRLLDLEGSDECKTRSVLVIYRLTRPRRSHEELTYLHVS